MKNEVRSLEEELQSEKSERAKLEKRLENLTSTIGNLRNTTVTKADLEHKIYIYASCQDAKEKGMTMSGLYNVELGDGQGPFSVYCDMKTDDGGWTVFQRRQDGSVDFYRNWADYQNGFGKLDGEFWLGLDKIHRLTRTPQLLRIDMQGFDGTKRFAKYKHFAVANGDEKYRMTFGQYNGDAGDFLTYHNGMKFTTKDSDNDLGGGNCAVEFRSAWWYKACHYSNLNGNYINNGSSKDLGGIKWDLPGYVLKFTEMKVRSD